VIAEVDCSKLGRITAYPNFKMRQRHLFRFRWAYDGLTV
jgi:hypothetical protein